MFAPGIGISNRPLLVSGSSDDVVGLVHPRRDIALTIQHAPDVDVVGPFDVENQMGIPRQRLAAQTRQVQFVRVAGRAACGAAADVAVGLFQGVDESERGRPGILSR